MVSYQQYRDCELEFEGQTFPATLIPIQMYDFDVILGMDWLAKYHANIDCQLKQVTVKSAKMEEVMF